MSHTAFMHPEDRRTDKTMWRMSWKTRKLWPVLPADIKPGSRNESRYFPEAGKEYAVDPDGAQPGENAEDIVCANCGNTFHDFQLRESIVLFNRHRAGWLVCEGCSRKERAIQHGINRRTQRAAFLAKKKGTA